MTKQLLNRFSNRILTTMYFILLLLVFPSPAFAACGTDPATFLCLNSIYTNILGLALAGGSIGFFIMILSGGIKWLTSSGDPKDIENAKNRITFAVFGLVLMVLVWLILKFIRVFTGVTDVTQFTVPF